jgi:2,4-dienoyl-CoA reductase-like NADH-dependent reductase (Old Yellow Enzyme family)
MIGLLDPLEVKGFTFKNRLVIPPMQTSLATSMGAVTDELIEYYTVRATVVGLVIVEHSYVSIEGKLSEKQLGIYSDQLSTGLEQLASQVHATGTAIVIQINHAGRTTSKEMTGFQPIAPSATNTAREIDAEELDGLAEKYVQAADRAIKAGFDGVEVHGAHSFLLNQFYSPLANKRMDAYGGSLENRIHFPLEVVKKVEKRIGNKLLLYRLGSVDLDPSGTQLADSKHFAVKLEEAGVDIIDISGGFCGSRPKQLQKTQGFFIPQAQAVKSSVNIPVIGVGGIRDPNYANRLINEEAVDLVAVGTPILNDAQWATSFLQQLTSR